MSKGTVKWFNRAKGYGFIEQEEGDKDAFVHITAVQRAGIETLFEGQEVEFELTVGESGRQNADQLVVIN